MAPSYAMTSEARDGVEIITLHQDDLASVAIVPAWGNNCFLFQVPEPILESVPFATFRQRPTSYGIPVLFPFPNRLENGTWTFRNQRYVVNPDRHGFVRDKPWSVCASGASEQNGAWITSRLDAVQYPTQILQQFPFPFRLEVTYRLKDRALDMETSVQNTGDHDLPLGFGIHPYFHRPAHGTLQVPARKRWELRESLPTGNLLDVEGLYDLRHPCDVTQLDLDDIFTDLIADADDVVRCILHDHEHHMRITVVFAATQFPHVVVYTPPAPRQAICIEPYTCPTDGFNLQHRGIESNLIVLQPGATTSFNVCVSTSSAEK